MPLNAICALHRRLLRHALVRPVRLRAAGQRAHLHRAGAFQIVHAQERIGAVLAERQRAVIAQHHRVLVCRCRRPDARARRDRARRLRNRDRRCRREIIIACWSSGSSPSFCADTATPSVVCRWMTQCASSRFMCSAEWMVKPAGFTGNGDVDDLVAVDVDLHQARRGDLLEQQAVRIDQEVMLRPRHARRDVREDHVVPAVQCDQPVGRGEIDADSFHSSALTLPSSEATCLCPRPAAPARRRPACPAPNANSDSIRVSRGAAPVKLNASSSPPSAAWGRGPRW